jgi:PAS domain S-box-containing protein
MSRAGGDSPARKGQLAHMPIKELLETADFFTDPMLVVSADGTIESANRPFAGQFDLTPEAIAGKRLDKLAALSAAAIEEYLRACAQSEKALEGALLFRRRSEVVPFRARGVALPPRSAPAASRVLVSLHRMQDSGRASSHAGEGQRDADAQAWREIEDSLRRQRQILEVTLASVGDAVIVTDAQGCITFLNSVAESLTGWSNDEAKNRPLATVFRILNEHTREPAQDPVARALQTGAMTGLANHTVLVARTGREIPLDDRAAPIRLPDGTVFGVVLIFRDITEQRRAEHTRGWLAAIVESSEDAIVSKTLDGVITSWNPAATRLFGYTAAEIVGKSITTIIPPELQDEEIEVLTRLRRGERIEHFETVRLAKSGQRIEVSLTVSPIRNQRGEVVGASKIARDIRVRKEAERRLRDSDQRKNEFLAMLGHELRNPLGPIRNVTELLCKSSHAHPELHTACGILERQVGVLTHLVDDLLDLARISTGNLRVREELIDLRELLSGTVDSIRHAFANKNQVITASIPHDPLFVRGDRVRLLQLFSNLLLNASKFTPAGGRVDLTLIRERETALIKIRDNGIGIPPELIEQVFELFAQVSRPSDSKSGGLGIGLPLSRRIAEMHGGKLTASSEGEGRGSEFVVHLPLVAAESTSQEVIHPRKTTHHSRRILIADDDEDAAVSLAMLLELMGHETRTAHDGMEALETAEQFHPEVVLLDLAMPKLDGYEAMRRIAGRPWARATVHVALTGWGQDSERERTRVAGFHRHLVKPVGIDELQELLASPPGDLFRAVPQVE